MDLGWATIRGRTRWATALGIVTALALIVGSLVALNRSVLPFGGWPTDPESSAPDQLLPAAGPGRGKGEAMWKSLAATTGDLVAWLDRAKQRAPTGSSRSYSVCRYFPSQGFYFPWKIKQTRSQLTQSRVMTRNALPSARAR